MEWSASMTVQQTAEIVKQDLIALNYDCVIISSTMPLVTENDEFYVIALRLSSIVNNKRDFHFMKMDRAASDVWRQKPGTMAILTYNYLPTNERTWSNEGIVVGIIGYRYFGGSLRYNSDIMFIAYASSHITTSTYTGNNYHGRGVNQTKHFYEIVKTCVNCGNTTTIWLVEKCDKVHPAPREVQYDQ